eukprot:CAMPEP_0170920766 /NCGR_PEP_ID=MMETSP0735-20130129/9418_1 /TAXON_ID=186038 /ORGANISM="Fragilariopsis kerguelensis, Strain L26-C5" /LENGTH=556 /DNA_ID=CAMNT_0011319787 /DNA_START=83 /DNA_END=1750 /DNA_ORIENTATION=+
MPILSDDVIVRISTAFKRADTNTSGTLTGSEIEAHIMPLLEGEGLAVVASHSSSGLASGVAGSSRLQARIDAMETKHNGSLTLLEVIYLIGYLKVMLICEVLFALADTDGSGVLEESEIKNVIKIMKERNGLEPPSEDEMDHFIQQELSDSANGESMERNGEEATCTFHTFSKYIIPKILKAAGVIDNDVVEVAIQATSTATTSTSTTTVVKKDNYALAESQVIFAQYCEKIKGVLSSKGVKTSGTNEFLHVPTAHDPKDRTIMRPNFDTLYSFAIVDLSHSDSMATLILPLKSTDLNTASGGERYQSALVISEEHWNPLIAEAPGTYSLTRESVGTPYCMIGMRTQVNMNSPEDLAKAHQLQAGLQLTVTGSSDPLVGYLPSHTWDMEEILSMRAHFEKVVQQHPEITSENMFGPRNSWPLLNHNCGTAYGWGGFPKEQAVYPQIHVPDSALAGDKGRYTLTMQDVPIQATAFWSITVYDEQGYVSTKDGDFYNINSAFAVADINGNNNNNKSYTIHFGNNYDKNIVPNVINIMPGWNITVRLYQPTSDYFDGTW